MQYELLYIVSATFADDDVGTVESVVRALLEKNGASVVSTKRLGKLRFAYPIKKSRYGNYVLIRFESEPSAVAKIEESLRIANDVVRHLILRADEAGEEKFDLVQFTEVNIEAKDEQPRRRREHAPADEQAKKADEIKSGVAALEGGAEASAEKEAPAAAISDEELDKKLAAALEDNA